MASITKRKEKNSKRPYVLSYFDPIKDNGVWQKVTFANIDDAKEEERRWDNIAHYHKTHNPLWRALYYEHGKVYTIKDVFDAYQSNVLDKKIKKLTVDKYQAVMKSVLQVFPENTPVESIRGIERDMKTGRKQGWEIYKAQRDITCTRNGINSYLRDIRAIFMWALSNGGPQGRGMVNFEVVTKSDKYNNSETPESEIKVWSDEEIMTLFTHPGLTEFHRDLLTVYTYTGARAVELLGYNYNDRNKELKWHHVDFDKRTISLLPKRKKSRKLAKQHPIVMMILKKWKEDGHEMPLPFAYGKLRSIIADINTITNIDFTCHDLRRLKAQMAEEENGDMQLAGYAIGDTTRSVVVNSYAPVSHSTMDKINDSVNNAINRKMGAA